MPRRGHRTDLSHYFSSHYIGSQGLNSGCQAWGKAPSPAKSWKNEDVLFISSGGCICFGFYLSMYYFLCRESHSVAPAGLAHGKPVLGLRVLEPQEQATTSSSPTEALVQEMLGLPCLSEPFTPAQIIQASCTCVFLYSHSNSRINSRIRDCKRWLSG